MLTEKGLRFEPLFFLLKIMTQVTKGGDNMVPIIISIVISLIILVVGVINIHRIRNEKLVGNLLIVEQDGEEPAYMLEVFQGESAKIKPGELVTFAVVKEKITLKKQVS